MSAHDIRAARAGGEGIDMIVVRQKIGPAGAPTPVAPGLTDMEVSAMKDRTCVIDGCDRPHYARNWCGMHYARWRRSGTPDNTDRSRGGAAETSPCSIGDCGRPARARGWCSMHYRRWAKQGDPNDPGKNELFRDPEEALRERSIREGDCLIWTGAISPEGYGQIRVGKKVFGVHRYAWIAKHGPIPDGLVVDHICHTPACFNVDHLRLATVSQNGANRGGAAANNTSGHRGLTWTESANMWTAALFVRGVRTSKHFRKDQKGEAVEWLRMKREEAFGEFAGWQV